MKVHIAIELDHEWVYRNIRELENDQLFQRLKRQKLVGLPITAQLFVNEVRDRGPIPRGEATRKWQSRLVADGLTIDSLIYDGYIVEDSLHGKRFISCPEVTGSPEPLSSDQIDQIRQQLPRTSQGSFLKAYVREVYRNFGSHGLLVIENVMSDMGRDYALALAEFKDKGPQVVGLRFVELMQSTGSPVTVVESTPDRVRFRAARCAYELGRGDTDVCHAVSAFDRSVIGELGCVINYHHIIPEGSAYCEGVVTQRTGTAVKSKSVTAGVNLDWAK